MLTIAAAITSIVRRRVTHLNNDDATVHSMRHLLTTHNLPSRHRGDSCSDRWMQVGSGASAARGAVHRARLARPQSRHAVSSFALRIARRTNVGVAVSGGRARHGLAFRMAARCSARHPPTTRVARSPLVSRHEPRPVTALRWSPDRRGPGAARPAPAPEATRWTGRTDRAAGRRAGQPSGRETRRAEARHGIRKWNHIAHIFIIISNFRP